MGCPGFRGGGSRSGIGWEGDGHVLGLPAVQKSSLGSI